jgi:hypothetical protein
MMKLWMVELLRKDGTPHKQRKFLKMTPTFGRMGEALFPTDAILYKSQLAAKGIKTRLVDNDYAKAQK